MTLSELSFIDPSKWSHCSEGKLQKWLQLLWPPHYDEADRCVVSGLLDFPVCSTMF